MWRVIRGPSIVDRVIGSDVLLTTLILVVGTEMVATGHTRTIPLMVVLAATALLGTVAVARFVTRPEGTATNADASTPASSRPDETEKGMD
nr:monovalent cation/H+ antiporter complex subunit F [Microcella alkalica]